MASAFVFLSARWKKLDEDSIGITIDQVPGFHIVFCRDQNLGRVADQLVELRQSRFVFKKSGELTEEWFLANGIWRELKPHSKEEWFEIEIDIMY